MAGGAAALAIQEVAIRLAAGLAAGALIGLEREWRQKIAGVRTNALVALSAAGFVMVAALSGAADDTRIASQIVTGVGFLGGGAILREGLTVRGLNTAATLWSAAMVGTLAGSGCLPACALAALLVVVANLVLRPLVRRLDARLQRQGTAESHYTLSLTADTATIASHRAAFLAALAALRMTPTRVETAALPNTAHTRLTVEAESTTTEDAVEMMMTRLGSQAGMQAATWEVVRRKPDS